MNKKALIVVDVQNDFCPGGSLAVPQGDEVIAPINQLVAEFKTRGDVVVFTKDYHPADHVSFASAGNAGIWPDHCVQNSTGAEFHPALTVNGVTFYKAFTPDEDSYSGFGGVIATEPEAQTLAEYLLAAEVTEAVVVGLALDYCVKATALDALQLGMTTSVHLAATRAVNVNPGDDVRAIAELEAKGINLIK